MAETIIQSKSFNFAVRVVKLYQYLCREQHEFILSKQLLRSGTSIGANVREAKRAQSTPDFGTKLSIALKEAEESLYWLELLKATDYLTKEQYENIYFDCEELVKLLSAATKKVFNKE